MQKIVTLMRGFCMQLSNLQLLFLIVTVLFFAS